MWKSNGTHRVVEVAVEAEDVGVAEADLDLHLAPQEAVALPARDGVLFCFVCGEWESGWAGRYPKTNSNAAFVSKHVCHTLKMTLSATLLCVRASLARYTFPNLPRPNGRPTTKSSVDCFWFGFGFRVWV